jgi:hypothetical protein
MQRVFSTAANVCCVNIYGALWYFVTNVHSNKKWKINCAAYTVQLNVTQPMDTRRTEDQQIQVLVHTEAVSHVTFTAMHNVNNAGNIIQEFY